MKKLIYLFSAILALVVLVSFSIPKDPWVIPAKYKAMKAPQSTSQSVAIGKTLWAKHCKSCHGTKGLGDGPKAKMLKTEMMNFSGPEFKKFKDGEKYYMSFVGRGEMPNFEKKIIDNEDRWALIHFINTL